MATTVLACMGAACTVGAGDQADTAICVESGCALGSSGSESGVPESTGEPPTTSIDPDAPGQCEAEYSACIEAGLGHETCDNMLVECQMNGSSSSATSSTSGPNGADTHGDPGHDEHCDAIVDCCVEAGSSASVCSSLGDACNEVEDCTDALGECGSMMPGDDSCADAYQSCREEACVSVIDACRPPDVDPYLDPCANALRQCGMHVHGCLRIFGTPTPQEFCESSIPDAEFCQAWIIVCEERFIACDELLASSTECSLPGAQCHDAWQACVEAEPAFEPCWDAFQTCELAPPDCPEDMEGDGASEPCTCVEQLDACVKDNHEGGDACRGTL